MSNFFIGGIIGAIICAMLVASHTTGIMDMIIIAFGFIIGGILGIKSK